MPKTCITIDSDVLRDKLNGDSYKQIKEKYSHKSETESRATYLHTLAMIVDNSDEVKNSILKVIS